MSSKLDFTEVPPTREESLAGAVLTGLSEPQKWLPSRLFYDERGSELFEKITHLPEYYPTRTEQGILDLYAAEMLERLGDDFSMVEFGSGSSCKTRTLIDAALARQERLLYTPIDISKDFLRATSNQLLQDYEQLSVHAIAAEYFDALGVIPRSSNPRLFLFLGSNIGNFDREDSIEFLSRLRKQMARYDRALIGIDLVKDTAVLEAAYNDAQGITEAFNKNVLQRINHELGGHFDLDLFRHSAPFVPEHSRIEMRLVSTADQLLTIDALGKTFKFREGEYIHTENSFKYTLQSFQSLCQMAGLEFVEHWSDARNWFAEVLVKPEAA